ncbi:hypothetical protein AKJ37_06030 [candidate division MSBL1 archaeon SCGC-AAA259I09]|uniref:Sodium:solute symporter n=1 Tax=candidate division MSBL1 archaeon SCGC-AAA259I09 TaxID=1698267 RepID=A0A133UPE5_9EURY|nr:hypothetical protein AKJ37_06030 [candidate division MSBL1 archaeon SCGC-AAA259I09]
MNIPNKLKSLLNKREKFIKCLVKNGYSCVFMYEMLAALSVILILIYLIYGVWNAYRHEQSIEDLWIANRKLSGPIVFFSMAASALGAGMFILTAGWGYTTGYNYTISTYLSWPIGTIIGVLLFTGKWKDLNLFVTPDPITMRFGRIVGAVAGFLVIIGGAAWAASNLVIIGRTLSVFFGAIPFWAIIVSIGIVILIYTLAGGMWSVAHTDMLQTFTFTAGAIALIGGLTWYTGFSPFNLGGEVAAWKLNWWPADMSWSLWSFNMLFIGITTGASTTVALSRIAAAKSKMTSYIYNTLSNVFVIVLLLVMAVIGLQSAIAVPGLEVIPEHIMAEVSVALYGEKTMGTLIAIGVAAFAACALSTSDSLSLSTATMFTKNYIHEFWPHFDRKQIRRVFRGFVVVFIALIVGLALLCPFVIQLWFVAGGYGTTPIFFLLIVALFWEKINRYGAAAFLSTYLPLYMILDKYLLLTMKLPLSAIIAFVVSVVMMIVFSYLTQERDPPQPLRKLSEKAEPIGAPRKLPTREEREKQAVQEEYKPYVVLVIFVLLWVGAFALAIWHAHGG